MWQSMNEQSPNGVRCMTSKSYLLMGGNWNASCRLWLPSRASFSRHCAGGQAWKDAPARNSSPCLPSKSFSQGVFQRLVRAWKPQGGRLGGRAEIKTPGLGRSRARRGEPRTAASLCPSHGDSTPVASPEGVQSTKSGRGKDLLHAAVRLPAELSAWHPPPKISA